FAFPVGPPKPVPDALTDVRAQDEMLQWTLSMHLDGKVPDELRRPMRPNVRDDLQRDPEAVAQRLIALFSDYWTYAFEQEWPEVEARLALARAEGARRLADGGIGSLLKASTRRARLANGGISVTPTIPADLDVDVQDDGRIPVVISLYSSPWV